jgi:hypothetical protein
MFRSVTEPREFKPKRFSNLVVLRKLTVWAHGVTDGPTHAGGVLPPGAIEPGLARIHSRGKSRIESYALSWGHCQFTIPAALEQARIELESAQSDLDHREGVLQAHVAEYRRTHRGMVPAATGTRARNIGFWILGAFFTGCEMPLTSAAFAALPISDWERLVATLGAAAVTIALSHQIGVSFARPAKTIGQRIFGWVLVVVLGVILAAMSAVRMQAIREHSNQPGISTPEVRLQFPQKGGALHV